jgi:hypothetical protein
MGVISLWEVPRNADTEESAGADAAPWAADQDSRTGGAVATETGSRVSEAPFDDRVSRLREVESVGTLLYGNPAITIDFDDRSLTHLQIAITTKLRRHESFLFSWTNSRELGSGRSSIWIDPSSVLYYRFLGSRIPTINPAWVAELVQSANSGTGLVFTPEPGRENPLTGVA